MGTLIRPALGDCTFFARRLKVARMLSNSIKITFIPVCVLLLLAGCSNNKKPKETDYKAKVSGTVMLDGKPMTGGCVTFVPLVPEFEGGRAGVAQIEKDGTYFVGNADRKKRGLVPGRYKVILLKMDLIDGADGAISAQLNVPERYVELATTPFEFDILEGANTVNLQLQSMQLTSNGPANSK